MPNEGSSKSALCNVESVVKTDVEQQNISLKSKSFSQIKKDLVIPEGYEFLPPEFFPYAGVLAPLVSKSWLELIKKKLEDDEVSNFSSEEDSEEDIISLAKLKSKLQNISQSPKRDNFLSHNNDKQNSCTVKNDSKKRVKKNNNNYANKKETKKKYPLIYRKRGRPRKNFQNKNSEIHLNETDIVFDDDKVFTNNDKNFWEGQINSSNFLLEGDLNLPEKKTAEENSLKDDNEKETDSFQSNLNYSDDEVTVNEGKENNVKNESSTLKNKAIKSNFPCLECGKSFSASSTLKNHQRIHNGTLVKCPECHKGFTTKYLLKCHMRIHNGDLFMCNKCNKGFTTAELLKVHNRCHTGDKPFVCNICGRSFPCASNLSQHKQTHDSEKKFLCSHCGSSFNQKRCLDGHMLTHSEKNHICTVCGKLWARKPDLVEHMRVHTGVKPYSCSACPQKFTQASSLKRHQMVHMNVKPIQCLTCNKMFKCQDYYKRHVKKHEKEFPYLLNNVTE